MILVNFGFLYLFIVTGIMLACLLLMHYSNHFAKAVVWLEDPWVTADKKDEHGIRLLLCFTIAVNVLFAAFYWLISILI